LKAYFCNDFIAITVSPLSISIFLKRQIRDNTEKIEIIITHYNDCKNMIRKSCKLYEGLRKPRMLRLRRSSGNETLENEYIKIYNIEEHVLYRKQELANIYHTYQYYKYKDEIQYWLNKKCGMCIYADDNEYELLGCYLIGESNTEEKADSKKIMRYRLDLKDKNLTAMDIHVNYCMSLFDRFSYYILLNT
jgi:hypothetical protein